MTALSRSQATGAALLRLILLLLSLMNVSSPPPIRESASVQWMDGELHVSVGTETWSVSQESLDTLIHLLEAGRSMTQRSGATTERAPAVLDQAPAPVAGPTRSKRRSRKRVGDALILWMEANSGWHHEDALLQVVIDHEMTDASPLRALKIALGKQRGVIFTDGGHGYWKLASDVTAGAVPQAPASPTVRQRILAQTGGGREGSSRSESGSREDRWSDVSDDEVARARRNLLGLGSAS